MSAKVSLVHGRYYAIVVNRQLPPHYPQRKLLRCKGTQFFPIMQACLCLRSISGLQRIALGAYGGPRKFLICGVQRSDRKPMTAKV